MMSALEILPVSHALHASVRVPGSKSLTNRALLIAALAAGKTCLTNALFSEDTYIFAHALQTLGFDVQLDAPHNEMSITGLGGRIPSKQALLFCGNAGTAARFLAAFLTLGEGEFVLDGDPRMRARPIGDLVSALTQLGARLEISASNCPPINISASRLLGGHTSIAGNISSQFLSGLLMVSPYAQLPVDIEVITELTSKPYIDLTLAVMCDFGIVIDRKDYRHFVIHPSQYQPQESYIIESDASAASYFFAAPAVCTGTVRVENINPHSKQGDISFLDILKRMGCIITIGADYIEVARSTDLLGVDVNMRDISDTAQTLAAIAPFATTPTRIRGITTSRVKETDRVSATCTELTRLGVRVEEHSDGLTIYPCEVFQPATIQTYNDHRMAMSFSLIGLRIPGLMIEDPACVSKTFPNYFEVLGSLQ
jgi:3-phosphoshikimate 1-carboxyvinyltransferase